VGELAERPAEFVLVATSSTRFPIRGCSAEGLDAGKIRAARFM